MDELNVGDDTLDRMAEEFARRYRAGEAPSVEEYAGRDPGRAGAIRAVLSAVARIEQVRPAGSDRPVQLGDYRIIREVGRGGMGIVYEAHDEALGRRVAVKVLPRHRLNEERLRTRFTREARAAARLSHPNIVPVFGTGEADGQCFYAMQFIDGVGLNVIGAAGGHQTNAPSTVPSHVPLPSPPQATTLPVFPAPSDPDFCRTVAALGKQVAEALAYAHGQGVLHRDVKPANLLLDRAGKVWVTDFGVAKLVEEANLTQTGDLVGTLRYMPPEQFAGKSDARGDVYSLGATLYELLTGRPPFPDAPPALLIVQIESTDPPRPTAVNPAIPAELEAVVLKAMAHAPGDRYATAADLADDLGRFLAGRPVLAKRAGATRRAWLWWRRNPGLAGMALVIVVLAIALAAALALPRGPRWRPGPPPGGPEDDRPPWRKGPRGEPPWKGVPPP